MTLDPRLQATLLSAGPLPGSRFLELPQDVSTSYAGKSGLGLTWNAQATADPSDRGLYFAAFTTGGDPFVEALQIVADPDGTLRADMVPDILTSEVGHTLAWDAPDLDGTGIFAQSLTTNGEERFAIRRLNKTQTDDQTDVSLTAFGSGFRAAWTSVDPDTSHTEVVTRDFSSRNSTRRREKDVSPEGDGDQHDLDIATVERFTGSAFVDDSVTAFVDVAAGYVRVVKTGLDMLLTGGPDEDLSQTSSPRLAALENNGFAVAFEGTTPSGETGVGVQVFSPEGTGFAPFFVESPEGTQVSDIVVTGLPGSGIVAAWETATLVDGVETSRTIEIVQLDATGARVTPIQRIDGPEERPAHSNPDLVTLPNGDVGLTFQAETAPDATDYSGDLILQTFFAGYVGTKGPDTYIDFANVNVMKGRGGNDSLDGFNEGDHILGGPGNDALSGLGGADTMGGGDGRDKLVGGSGPDMLNGNRGNDSLTGGTGRDLLRGNQGKDLLNGGDDGDTMQGGRGADTLVGGEGRDQLSGGPGADTLDGGQGTDLLTGGGGADQFVFTAATSSTIDTITDLGPGDQIALLGFSTGPTLRNDGIDVVLQIGGTDVALIQNTDIESVTAALL